MSVTPISETRTYDRELEAVRERVLPGVINVAIDSQPILWIFAARNVNSRFSEQGPRGAGKQTGTGESIVKKIRVGKNDTVGSLNSPYATYNLTPQHNVVHARYNWKLYGGSVSIDDHLEKTGGGGMMYYNAVEEEMMDAANSLGDDIASDLYSNGGVTTNVNDLDSIISANDSIGGLSGATYAPWNSRGLSARGTSAGSISFAGGAFSTTGLANWRIAFDNASEGGSLQPNVLLTTYDIKQFYEAKIQAQERYAPVSVADAGHPYLQFRKAVVVPDPKCPSGATYFINTSTLFALFLTGMDFDSTPFHQPDNQRVKVSLLSATLELVCIDRKSNNKITGQTA